jgi:ribosome-associated toxin RatA of RatAB toxin-antitoxin module
LAVVFCVVVAESAAAECRTAGADPASEVAFSAEVDAAELLARTRREAIVVDRHGLTLCDETRAVAISGAVLLDAPPAAVWSVLSDFDSWPRFVPHLEHVALERADSGRRISLFQRTRLFGMAFEYTTHRQLDPERGLMWVSLDRSRPHDVTDLAGLWRVIPVDGGSRTLLCFQSYVQTSPLVPAFVERSLIEKSVPRSLHAFADEIASRELLAAAKH